MRKLVFLLMIFAIMGSTGTTLGICFPTVVILVAGLFFGIFFFVIHVRYGGKSDGPGITTDPGGVHYF